MELPNVITINIIDYLNYGPDKFHTTYHLREDTFKDFILTDALEIHFVDMRKFRALVEKDIKNDPLHRWLSFFDHNTPEEVLEEVLKMDPAIQKAQERMTFVSGNKEALRLYKMREMAQSDFTSGINNAKREGKKEGKKEDAKNALQEGIPVDVISRITGLDEAVIRTLQ
jgi:predicted transposase/invertase (TIGR01784 family)